MNIDDDRRPLVREDLFRSVYFRNSDAAAGRPSQLAKLLLERNVLYERRNHRAAAMKGWGKRRSRVFNRKSAEVKKSARK